MAILPIVTYDDPVLRNQATAVQQNSDEIQQFIDDMLETMYNADGIGLAAPQVGVSDRIFVIDADPVLDENEDTLYGPMVFINPEITGLSGDKVMMDEGCLSLPELTDKVKRHEIVEVKFLDRNFEEQEMEFDGWMSRVIQHEYDHLDGILFIDHISMFRRRMHKTELDEIANGQVHTRYPLAPKL